MEKIRSPITDYTPFEGVKIDQQKKIELIYFISPHCDGACAHCWSAETNLGRIMPIAWHQKFWSRVDPNRISQIKLSGGETLLYKDLGKVIQIIRKELGPSVPIVIFTSGRQLASIKKGKDGISETRLAIKAHGLSELNVEIQMSADEFHAGALYQRITHAPATYSKEENERYCLLGEPMLKVAARNFLIACKLEAEDGRGFKGGRLKVHTGSQRLAYHRQHLFSWMSNNQWRQLVISSEGLIKAGRAKQLEDSFEIQDCGPVSLFLLPGAQFYSTAISSKSQDYRVPQTGQKIFLDNNSLNGPGAAIIGWWNIINRKFCGGSAEDALSIIGR